MNDYFRKWCCLLVIDHPAINGKPEGSFDTTSYHKIISLVEELGCHCYIYASKQEEHDLITWIDPSVLSENNIAEDIFSKAFKNNFRKVILIDHNKPVTAAVLQEAFSSLKMIEFCMGPSGDGCYLFGMNMHERLFFQNSPKVFLSDRKLLIRNIGQLKLALYKTPLLPEFIHQGN